MCFLLPWRWGVGRCQDVCKTHMLLATQSEIFVCSQPVIYEADLNLLLREGMS